MAQEEEIFREETLDPEDWESMRALGHRMLDITQALAVFVSLFFPPPEKF